MSRAELNFIDKAVQGVPAGSDSLRDHLSGAESASSLTYVYEPYQLSEQSFKAVVYLQQNGWTVQIQPQRSLHLPAYTICGTLSPPKRISRKGLYLEPAVSTLPKKRGKKWPTAGTT